MTKYLAFLGILWCGVASSEPRLAPLPAQGKATPGVLQRSVRSYELSTAHTAQDQGGGGEGIICKRKTVYTRVVLVKS